MPSGDCTVRSSVSFGCQQTPWLTPCPWQTGSHPHPICQASPTEFSKLAPGYEPFNKSLRRECLLTSISRCEASFRVGGAADPRAGSACRRPPDSGIENLPQPSIPLPSPPGRAHQPWRGGRMTTHRLALPRPGGEWRNDPGRDGLTHRGGRPWDRVRTRCRVHMCSPQSCLTWTFRTKKGTHTAAVLWCACGAVSYPGVRRWLGKNIRRACLSSEFPLWHQHLIDLDRPAAAFERLRERKEATNVDGDPGGWHRAGDNRVAAGGEHVQPTEHPQELWLRTG